MALYGKQWWNTLAILPRAGKCTLSFGTWMDAQRIPAVYEHADEHLYNVRFKLKSW
jgi:hypothetical protein